MKKAIVSCFLVMFFSVVCFHSLYAGLKVEPVALELVAKDGGKVTGIFNIINPEADPVHVVVKPEQWATDDYTQWLKIEPMEFDLKNSEKKEVVCTITPPPDRKGELKCMVFFVADKIDAPPNTIGIRFGVPIYAIIGGTEHIDVTIKDIEVTYGNGVIRGNVIIDNKSNIHIRPMVMVKVKDKETDQLTNIFHLPYGQPAQENQVRPFMFEEDQEFKPGKYTVIAEVDYGALYSIEAKAIKEVDFLIKRQGVTEDLLSEEEKEKESKRSRKIKR